MGLILFYCVSIEEVPQVASSCLLGMSENMQKKAKNLTDKNDVIEICASKQAKSLTQIFFPVCFFLFLWVHWPFSSPPPSKLLAALSVPLGS